MAVTEKTFEFRGVHAHNREPEDLKTVMLTVTATGIIRLEKRNGLLKPVLYFWPEDPDREVYEQGTIEFDAFCWRLKDPDGYPSRWVRAVEGEDFRLLRDS